MMPLSSRDALRTAGRGMGLVLVPVLVFIGRPAAAQELGPKDGRNLAATDTGRVAVGAPAPDFTLAALDGRRITLSDYRGSRIVVLVFYRGHW